jgi:twitching motility protein PilT
MMQTSQNVGMQTLEMHLKDLVQRNIISKETAIEKTGDENMFKELEQGVAGSKRFQR